MVPILCWFVKWKLPQGRNRRKTQETRGEKKERGRHKENKHYQLIESSKRKDRDSKREQEKERTRQKKTCMKEHCLKSHFSRLAVSKCSVIYPWHVCDGSQTFLLLKCCVSECVGVNCGKNGSCLLYHFSSVMSLLSCLLYHVSCIVSPVSCIL